MKPRVQRVGLIPVPSVHIEKVIHPARDYVFSMYMKLRHVIEPVKEILKGSL